MKAGGVAIAAKDIAYCWNALSFFPERRAKLEVEGLADRLNGFADKVALLLADEEAAAFDAAAEITRFAAKHIALTRAFWNSESRCASSFITGPSNFPGAMMEKRGRWASNRLNALLDHPAHALRSVSRKAFPFGHPGDAIRANNPAAVELLNRKVSRLRRLQQRMKLMNAAHAAYARKPEGERARDLMGALSAQDQATVVNYRAPYAWEPHPFAPFQLSNLNAKIKAAEARLTSVQAMQDRGSSETERDGIKIVENAEAARIQLIFPGKPAADTRAKLKALGFRWAPSEGAWQRHLNSAGRAAVASFFVKAKENA